MTCDDPPGHQADGSDGTEATDRLETWHGSVALDEWEPGTHETGTVDTRDAGRDTDLPDRIDVLHVDDDNDLSEVTRSLLEREDERLSVRTETDPARALETVQAEEIDCVVSDYDMPGMDGLELLGAVRDIGAGEPFILYTGKGSEEIASEAISAGVTDYVQKGGIEQCERLAHAVRQAVAARAARRHRRELEYRYRHIVEHSPNAVFVDSDDKIVYANPAMADLVGADDPCEVVGLSPGTFFQGEAARKRRRRVEQVRAEGQDLGPVELTLTRLDGATRRVESCGGPIPQAGETAIQVVLRDLTDLSCK
ncbi:MAG: response regulator [Salinirussus sp.]